MLLLIPLVWMSVRCVGLTSALRDHLHFPPFHQALWGHWGSMSAAAGPEQCGQMLSMSVGRRLSVGITGDGAQPCSAVPVNPVPAGMGWGPRGAGGLSAWSLGLAGCALDALAIGVPAVSSLCAVSVGQDAHCWGAEGAAGASSPFPVPFLSFSANVFVGSGCRPSRSPLVRGFGEVALSRRSRFGLCRAAAPGSWLHWLCPGSSGMLRLLCTPNTGTWLLPWGNQCWGLWCAGVRCWAVGAVQGIPLPPQRRWHLRCGGESRRWRLCRDPWQLGRVVPVFPRSAPGVIAETGTWGNSHPSPGMVMSQEDSKTNGSLRSSAALQDFSSHQPLHQQRQHLSRSLSPALEKMSGSWGRCQN